MASQHRINILTLGVAFVLLSLAFTESARAADTTTLTWHGHSAFEIVTPNGQTLFVDPWLKNPVNPQNRDNKDPLSGVTKADYILITHGHFDHIGDAVEIARKTKARLITNYELGTNIAKLLGFPKDQMGFDTLMNIGGQITVADGEVTIVMVPAVHSSGIGNPLAGDNEPDIAYGGSPAGFVIKIKNGPTIYHSGDTAFFTDMRIIGEMAPDIALICIGGHFGMEPAVAARAAKSINGRLTIPHHYATFPVLAQDPKPFVDEAVKRGVPVRVLQPGATLTFRGRRILGNP